MNTTVVVGSGSSGGPLAARLSEDESHHVIVIEAGPDYPNEQDVPESLRDPNASDLFGHDWGFQAYALDPPHTREAFPYLRGRVIGGTSAVATVALRGIPEDFDAWAAAGNDEWSWDAVLPLFRRIENDLDYGDAAYHGSDGPVPITRAQRHDWPHMMQAFEAACIELGHPVCPDANAPDATGVGPAPRNMTATLRASSLSTYIHAARSRPNLEIRARTHVDRIIFDGHRAIGVEARRDGDAVAERVLADRVVLCAGAIKSPQILMLSGLGPAGQLGRLGIETLVDLPVGRTLVDHPAFTLLGLSTDAAPSRWGPHAQLQYSSEHGTRNDMWVRTSLLPPGPMFQPPEGVKAAVWLSGVVGKPRSVGSLHLTSADPTVQPELRLNFLADLADRSRARELIRMLYGMATRSPLADEIGQIVAPQPGIVDDDERLDAWLRETAGTAYHAACTCRMGPHDDDRAVVDQRLAVHGTEGLYVADASVMPEITTNATNLACFMIGERLADLLKASV